VREQCVQAVLRDESHDVRQHPLADVLFRVDFWIEDTNFDLFTGNHLFPPRVRRPKTESPRGAGL